MNPALQPAIDALRKTRPDWSQAELAAILDPASHPRPEVVVLALVAGLRHAPTPADCLGHPWMTKALAAADQLDADARDR